MSEDEQLKGVTSTSFTALHLAASNVSGCGESAAAACRALLGAGADLEAQTGDEGVVNGVTCTGLTPLLVAARAGCAEVTQFLLASGASTSATDAHYEGTALHWAACHGHSRCVEVLLAAGVPRDAPTKHGGTALHSACGRGMSSCVRALLAARASTALRNGEGKSCLEKAAENGHLDIVRLLGQGFAAA